MAEKRAAAVLAMAAKMVDTSVRPGPPGWFRLVQWFVLVLGGMIAWLLILSVAFGIRLSADVFTGAVKVPEAAQTLYVVGLYVLLMGAAWRIWKLDGGRVRVGFTAARWLEGWGTGLLGLGILTGVEVALGLAAPVPGMAFNLGHAVGLVSAVLVASAFAISEEALFRGFMLGLLGRSLAPLAAVWGSGLIFAALHFLRPLDLTAVVVPFAALASAGALLAACRMRTGSLWLGIGLHSAWVWFITANGQQGWLSYPEGGHLWTGGGSPAGGLLGLVGVGFTYLWLRWRFPEPGSLTVRRGDRESRQRDGLSG